MNIIRRLDKGSGIALRWIANKLTGNILVHMEKRLMRRLQIVEERIIPSLESINRVRDDLERLSLDIYKKANRE